MLDTPPPKHPHTNKKTHKNADVDTTPKEDVAELKAGPTEKLPASAEPGPVVRDE